MNSSEEGSDFITGRCRQSLNGKFVRKINEVASVRTAKHRTGYCVSYEVNDCDFFALETF
jgi:hypothetical protein